MRVLSLLGLLLVVTRPTRSVTTKPGHGWNEPLGSGQANAATTIASSAFSDTMSPSQELANDKTPGVHYPVFKCSTLKSNLLKGNSLLACGFSNTNRVDQFGESSSMSLVEWHSSPGSKIDASHMSIDSQQLSQQRENFDCLIDLNRIPIDSEILPSKDLLENFVPSNRNAHRFGDSFSRNLADWTLSTSSNRDVSRISIDDRQSIESVAGKTFDCRIENTINSKTQPVDVRENFVPEGFAAQTHKMVDFRNCKYLLGLRLLCRRLNWDLDEVKDYASLCLFLGKETNSEQVEFPNSVAMTEHMMGLLLRGESERDNAEVGQNNIDAPDTRLIAKATSTMQKLIRISNFVLKLVSCRRSLRNICHKVIHCLKHICIPVLQCLVKCCGKDMDLFQTRWGTRFKHRYFGFKCCPGPGSNYNTCGYQRTKIVRNPNNRDKDSDFLDLKALVAAVSMSKTAEKKLNLCWKVTEKYLSCGAMSRRPYRTYYHESPKPIWGCFVYHCGHNTNEWIRRWGPQFSHSKFGLRKCHGLESSECGSINRPFDIPARLKLRYKATRDLLTALSGIFEEYDQFVIAKTASQRSPHPDLTTFIRTSRPIYNCFRRHCAGSAEEFIRRWGESVFYTSFSSNCCPGTDTRESDICQYGSRSSQGWALK